MTVISVANIDKQVIWLGFWDFLRNFIRPVVSFVPLDLDTKIVFGRARLISNVLL